MWLDEADGFAELFRGYLPYYLLVALPIFIIMSPVNPVAASHEFSVYRMQQYDLHTVPHGCRSASLNLEGRSLKSWATSRHCVVAHFKDVSIEQMLEIRSKAGGLLLVLPKNDTVLTDAEKQHIQMLEMAMSQQEFLTPVYFMHWTQEVDDIINDLQHSFITDDKSGTALEAMINSVSSNGYQIVVTAPTPQKLDSKPVTLHGKLHGKSAVTPTIVISATYDAQSIVPELSFGADTNASGAVALLELARIFSRLYSSTSTRGDAPLLFVLSGTGGGLNYFSIKKWLDEQVDNVEGSLLQDVQLALCVESLSGAALSLHVSRAEGATARTARLLAGRLSAPTPHKKINLAAELLAWPHERYSIRRRSAATLSTTQSHKEPGRYSLLDTPSEQGVLNLITNIKKTARALASHIYNLTEDDASLDQELFDDALSVDEASIRHWYKYLTSQPRSPHIITTAGGGGVTGVTAALERALSRYVGEAVASVHAPDRREPEYALYGPTRATLYVYSVKPAVFDLILTLAIVAYLGVVYFVLQYFPVFYEEFARVVTSGKVKTQ